jgi:zinc transporter 9
MLVASFVAGCIPLATKLSDSKLNFLTSLSVGLLISTSLVVIIPEGVETLYSTKELQSDQDHATEEAHSFKLENHTAIGLALLIGFAVMFIIDQVSSMHVHPSSVPTANANIKNRNSLELDAILETNNNNNDTNTNDNNTTETSTTSSEVHSSVATPTIGLIVHAAADGIALGASATHPQLSMVVFFAIMLHKAPSAFALTTVLLSEGLSRTRVRQHLLMFSISAPAGAITTYILLQLFSESSSSLNLEYWTGILLLFSGGTFLYVAMHAIQELKSSHDNKIEPNHTHTDWNQLGSILIGMFIPFILNLNHSH